MKVLDGLTEEERRDLIVSVGTHRGDRRLSPMEVANLMRRAIEAGATRSDLSDVLGLGRTQVSTFLALLELEPSVGQLADWGAAGQSAVAFSSVAQLARVCNRDQEAAARAILEHRLSWKEVVQLVQVYDRGDRCVEDAVRAVVALRPTVERRYVLLGSVVSDGLREALDRLSQVERDRLFKKILLRVGNKVGHGLDVRLGSRRFSLVGDRDPVEALGFATANELEAQINEGLRTEIGPS